MTNQIHVNKTMDGYAVETHKTHGINKGITILATTCGGNLGARLAMEIALFASKEMMIDDIIFDIPACEEDLV